MDNINMAGGYNTGGGYAISWIDRFTNRRPQLEQLLDGHRYNAALELLDELKVEDRDEAELAIRQLACLYWLAEADRACHDGDRSRMNASMAQAARHRREEFRPAFLETRRRIRDHTLSLTVAAHWHELLEVAAAVRNQLHEPDAEAPGAFATFSNRTLSGGMDAAGVENLDAEGLNEARPRLVDSYPESLRPLAAEASVEFIRAALWVAVGRPDLAVPALLELPDSSPLVCLERARTAYALGRIGTTMLGLGDFAMHHGQHETIRRLNTGVFMAQMAEMLGDAARAVEILERVQLEEVGRRPILLLARLYGEIGKHDHGIGLLDDWLRDNPDDVEAQVLKGALAAR